MEPDGAGAIRPRLFWPPKGFFQTAYQSSKAGLVSAMYHLANELGADKIRVNTVVPTWMWGPPVEGYVNMTADAQGIPPEQVIAGITQNMPLGEIPSETVESRALSKDLKRRGFRFVGPTVCYAFMQATGLVNDHVVACFRYAELGGAG